MIMFLMFFAILILLFMGLPTPITMALVSIVSFILVGGVNDNTIFLLAQRMYAQVNGITMMAIPFFLLMGNLMDRSGISEDLFGFARACLGHLHGGLGAAAIAACMVMSAMSGSAAAVAAGIGMIAIKEMTKSGYERDFSGALIACSGSLGPIIPPSLTLIMYATLISGVSVASLFAGGIIPGVIIGVLFIVYCTISCKKRNYPRVEKASFKELLVAFRKAIWALLTPVIVLGGIFGGIFTATESAAIAAFYALCVGGLVYKTLKLKDLPGIFWETAKGSGKIYFMIACAAFFQYVLMYTRIPQQGVSLILGISSSVVPMLIILIVLVLIMGCFLEGTAILMICVPLFVPLAQAYGYDLVQLGVLICITGSIGVITPPVGLNLYVVSGISGSNILKLAKEAIPYVVIMTIVAVLVAFVPQLTTTLAYL